MRKALVVQRFARFCTNLGNLRISQDICYVRMTDNNDFLTIYGHRANLLNNNIWTTEEIPEDWLDGLLVKLPKKGDTSYCKTCRGIILLSIPSKVLSSIMVEKMEVHGDGRLREEQAGFRNGRSCADQIATLGIIIEQSIESQTSLYLNFVDFEKAFDSIDHQVL